MLNRLLADVGKLLAVFVLSGCKPSADSVLPGARVLVVEIAL